MSTNGKGLRVLSLQAEKIQRLEFVRFDVNEANMIEITGANEQGKSSCLDLVKMAMGGKSATSIDPVKKGSDKGKIVIDLGKYLLTKTITRKGEYLRIESKDGAVYKSPQQLIDSWKNDFSLDPLAFANAKPEIQRAMLMKAISLPVSGERIKELAGIVVKVDENNPLAAIDQAKKEVEGLRREKGRDLLREKGAAEAIVIPKEFETVERIDAQEILQKKTELEQQKASNEARRNAFLGIVTDIFNEQADSNKAEREKLTKIASEGKTLKASLDNLRDREKDIEEQIKKLQDKLTVLNAQVVEGDQKFEELRANYKTQEEVVTKLLDPNMDLLDAELTPETLHEMTYEVQKTGAGDSLKSEFESEKAAVLTLQDPDFSELDRKIEEAQRINQIVFQREQKGLHMESRDAAQKEYDEYTNKISLLSQYREDLLTDAKIPVPGLSINEEGVVVFEDVPVSQRGKSMRIRIGLAVCAALRPEVRVILVYDGNDIDSTGMQIIYDWAKEHDFQVWIERIQNSGKGGVAFEISEGKVKDDHQLPLQTGTAAPEHSEVRALS